MSGPADPFASLSVAAAAMHEMYLSLKKAGFGRWEALYLIAVMAVTGTQGGPDDSR